MKNDLPFKPHAGLQLPSTNFQRTRDGRTSLPLYYVVDLSTARSIAANTQLSLPIAGNVFYADPLYDLTGVSQAGIARVHFQDTNLGAQGTPFTVLPQFITRFTFTQLVIENYAQPGKFLAIVYGVDVDLQPGLSNQVLATILNNPLTVGGSLGAVAQALIGGVNALPVTQTGVAYGASVQSLSSLLANTPATLVAPGTNVNGVKIWRASFYSRTATPGSIANILAKASAPATVLDGDTLIGPMNIMETAGPAWTQSGWLDADPILVPAGKGVYAISNTNETNRFHHMLFTVL